MLALPRPSFVNVPVTIIVWTAGGRTAVEGHLSPEQVAARGRGAAASITHTTSAAEHALPGVLI